MPPPAATPFSITPALSAINLKAPFLKWVSGYIRSKEAVIGQSGQTIDITFGPSASIRMALGYSEQSGRTYIGVSDDSDIALSDLDVSSVVFGRRIKDADWVVLIADNIAAERDIPESFLKNINPGSTPPAIQVRLWFPAGRGLLDSWSGIPPSAQIVLGALPKQIPRTRIISESDFFTINTLPLSLKGNWRGVEIITNPKDDPANQLPLPSPPMPEMAEASPDGIPAQEMTMDGFPDMSHPGDGDASLDAAIEAARNHSAPTPPVHTGEDYVPDVEGLWASMTEESHSSLSGESSGWGNAPD